jgi:hypothetical protein
MSTIFGLAQLSASDYQYMQNANQAVIYNAVREYVAITNGYRRTAYGLFVQTTTEKTSERIKLGMTGRMQRTRSTGAKPDAVRRSGAWDVGYPLEEFSDAVNTSDVDFSYMNPEEFQAHVDGIINRANETYRFEIFRRVFKNTSDTFTNERDAAVTVQPLANGDGTLYWPVAGTNADAEADYYAGANYLASAISDTNNPIATITDALTLRWGRMTGERPIVVLINSAQALKVKALSNFIPYVANAIIPGVNTDRVTLPSELSQAPLQVIGYTDSAWVAVFDWIPANYMVGVHLDAEKPLKERIDIQATGLGSGLQLVASERDYPILYNTWRLRFGIGAGNRLNGYVLHVTNSSSYTIPTVYDV